jgi:hypothetical protein
MQLHIVFLSSYYALKDVNWEVAENFCQKRKFEGSVFNLLIFKFQKLRWTGMNIGKCLLNLTLERNKFLNNLYSNSYIQLHAIDLLWDPKFHTLLSPTNQELPCLYMPSLSISLGISTPFLPSSCFVFIVVSCLFGWHCCLECSYYLRGADGLVSCLSDYPGCALWFYCAELNEPI